MWYCITILWGLATKRMWGVTEERFPAVVSYGSKHAQIRISLEWQEWTDISSLLGFTSNIQRNDISWVVALLFTSRGEPRGCFKPQLPSYGVPSRTKLLSSGANQVVLDCVHPYWFTLDRQIIRSLSVSLSLSLCLSAPTSLSRLLKEAGPIIATSFMVLTLLEFLYTTAMTRKLTMKDTKNKITKSEIIIIESVELGIMFLVLFDIFSSVGDFICSTCTVP